MGLLFCPLQQHPTATIMDNRGMRIFGLTDMPGWNILEISSLRQRFCVGAYKIWSHRGAKSGHEMNVTRICTSNYLRTFGVIFHHTAHVTSRLKTQNPNPTLDLLAMIPNTSSPLNQSGEAVA